MRTRLAVLFALAASLVAQVTSIPAAASSGATGTGATCATVNYNYNTSGVNPSAATADVSVATLPAKALVTALYMQTDTTFVGTGINALVSSLGRTGAGNYTDYSQAYDLTQAVAATNLYADGGSFIKQNTSHSLNLHFNAVAVGTVTANGTTTVTWVSGPQFVTGMTGTITIGGTGYTIASVTNATTIVTTGAVTTGTGVAYTYSGALNNLSAGVMEVSYCYLVRP